MKHLRPFITFSFLLVPAVLLFQNCTGNSFIQETELFNTKLSSSGNGDGYGGKVYATVDTTNSCGLAGESDFSIKDQFEVSEAGIIQTIENCRPLSPGLLRPDLRVTRASTDQTVLIVDERILESRRPTWTDRVLATDFVDVYCQALSDTQNSRGDHKRYEILVHRVHDIRVQVGQKVESGPTPTTGPSGEALPTPPVDASPPPDLEIWLRSATVHFQWLSELGEITPILSTKFGHVEEPQFPIHVLQDHRMLRAPINQPTNPGFMLIDTHFKGLNPMAPDGFRIQLRGQAEETARSVQCWQAH